MSFGTRTSEPDAVRMVQLALDHGVRRFDTANIYGEGESERILGRALRGQTGTVRVSTKVGLWRNEGLSADRIEASLLESLERLRLESVEVYFLHVPDPKVPLEATLEGVGRVLASGRAAAWGVSNYASWQILELSTLALRMGLPPPRASQVLYNLLVRQLEIEYLAYTRAHPIETEVYNPLAGGLLGGQYLGPEPDAPANSRFKDQRYRKRYWSEPLRTLARELAALSPTDLPSLAIQWLLAQAGVQRIVLGPRTVTHLEHALQAAAQPKLPADLLAKIDALHQAYLGTDARYGR